MLRGLMMITGLRNLMRNRARGIPLTTWDQVVVNDLKEKGIDPTLAQERLEWKSAINNPV